MEPTEAGQEATSVTNPGIYEQLLPPHNRRYTIAVPEGYAEDRPTPLILALHYGGTVTPFYGKGLLVGLVEPALRDLGAIIVAPDNVAAGWSNPESEANVLALLDAIYSRYNIDEGKTLITGYSLGGMGTWYLAARHPRRFKAAIPIAGRPQADVLETTWRIPLYVLHGRDDEIIPLGPTETAVRELQKQQVEVTLEVIDGITHYDTGGFVGPLSGTVPWIQSAWMSD
jgi:predicted peptidase